VYREGRGVGVDPECRLHIGIRRPERIAVSVEIILRVEQPAAIAVCGDIEHLLVFRGELVEPARVPGPLFGGRRRGGEGRLGRGLGRGARTGCQGGAAQGPRPEKLTSRAPTGTPCGKGPWGNSSW